MGNQNVPIFEYGYYGYNVFEVPSQTVNTKLLPKVDVDSMVNTTFNMNSKSVLVDVDINTGDYYDLQNNEGDYANLVEFVKVNQFSRIPKISSIVKILLNYTITTMDAVVVDAGVKIAEVPMLEGIMPMGIMDAITASYRFVKYFACTFTIDRFNPVGGGVNVRSNVRTPFPINQNIGLISSDKFLFQINSVSVLGTELGNERNIPKSMNGGKYGENSQTVLDIQRDSIELFSSVWYDLEFATTKIPAYVTSISIPVKVVTPMIVTTDPSDIDKLLALNGENYYPGSSMPQSINVDMFKPLLQRPICPGVLSHDYFKYWTHKVQEVAPNYHGGGTVSQPIMPGPEYPCHGNPPKIDVNHIDDTTPAGVYSAGGVRKYSWAELLASGAITVTCKNGKTIIGTPDAPMLNPTIPISDIGPILIIPAPVETDTISISESSFFGYQGLKVVYIPKELDEIGHHAFYSCTQLEAVKCTVLSRTGVKVFGDNAFMNCSNLRHVDTTLSLESIGERAFFHCSLLYLTVPPSVTTIKENAFHEMYRVLCSPKTDLSVAGIYTSDIEYFDESHVYYRPEDFVETPVEPPKEETKDPVTGGEESTTTPETGGKTNTGTDTETGGTTTEGPETAETI